MEDTTTPRRRPGRPPKPGSAAWHRQQQQAAPPPAPAPAPVRILGSGPPAGRPGADVVRIYGLMGADGRYHYVGQTRRPLDARLAEHRTVAARGGGGPLGDWLRAEEAAGITIHLLTTLVDPTPSALYQAEQRWIHGLLASGAPLTNVAVAGDPPAAVPLVRGPDRGAPPPADRPRRGPGRRAGLGGAILLASLVAVLVWAPRLAAPGRRVIATPAGVAADLAGGNVGMPATVSPESLLVSPSVPPAVPTFAPVPAGPRVLAAVVARGDAVVIPPRPADDPPWTPAPAPAPPTVTTMPEADAFARYYAPLTPAAGATATALAAAEIADAQARDATGQGLSQGGGAPPPEPVGAVAAGVAAPGRAVQAVGQAQGAAALAEAAARALRAQATMIAQATAVAGH